MSESELAKAYEPKDIERRIYAWWLERGVFTADPDASGDPYCIVIPPPNVTGVLHIGHALVNTLQDVLVRRARMQGRRTLWLPGTDHAGIATQLVVERKLRDEGKDRRTLGREAFLAEVWAWKEKHGNAILSQLQSLGASCDWTRTRFTMDEGLSHAVREVFVRSWREGLIYRGPYMVNWCPRCGTALSDLEAEHEERDGTLWSFAYPLEDGSGEVVVATTRPETMLGDTAVAVHPSDERYAAIVGRRVRLPLMDRSIPVVADDHVESAFGTGAVKVTPAHDPNDHEIGKRHGLEVISVIGHDGRMTAAAGAYASLSREEARRQVLADLEAAGLRRGEKPHRHAVAQCQRCDTVVEPLVSTQWWMKVGSLAEAAVAAVEDGRTVIVPDQYRKVYLHWMRNVRDWCISRQLWWGHRIPAWYCPEDHVTVATQDPAACAACGSKDLRQDEDVLDTWFSSALWPFSTMGWPEQTRDLATWYPTTTLVTAFDILFFWVARMMMTGLRFMGDVPFRNVFIHGLVRDARGEKMSKVKGNVIDPLEVIDQSGADALRFTLAIMAVPARDIPWNPSRMEGYRTFANKLWQAARFVLMNLPDDFRRREVDEAELAAVDRFILSRLRQTARTVNQAVDEFRFHEAADAIYHFAWDEYCAWYIEMAKPAFSKDAALAGQAEVRRQVLVAVLDETLRLLHPFMPFLTEELWQHLPRRVGDGETIVTARYPDGAGHVDEAALAEVALLQQVVVAVRNLRAEYRVDPRRSVPVELVASDAAAAARVREHAPLVASLARTEAPVVLSQGERSGRAVAEAGAVSVRMPLAGLFDVAAERERLRQQLVKLEKELAALQGRLSNEGFTAKAPPAVVAEATARRDELVAQGERMRAQLAALSE